MSNLKQPGGIHAAMHASFTTSAMVLMQSSVITEPFGGFRSARSRDGGDAKATALLADHEIQSISST